MVTSLDAYHKYGDPTTRDDEGKYLEVWAVPDWVERYIPTIPRSIYLNREIIVPLESALMNIIDRGIMDQVKTWDGCFNIRPIRGYAHLVTRYKNEGNVEKAMRYMSLHSWALGIDINAAWNRLGEVPSMSPELVSCFTEAGWDWGGNFKRPDGMHFQPSYLTDASS